MLLKDTGVNTRTVNALAKKKIYTDDDVLRRLPRTYKDYREVRRISTCDVGTYNAVSGVLKYVSAKAGQKRYLSIRIQGQYNTPFSILIFSRLYLYESLLRLQDKEVVVTGKVGYDETYGYNMNEPDDIVLASDFTPGIVPVYTKIGGVTDATYKKLLDELLMEAHEPFEWELMNKVRCTDYRSALVMCHHPKSEVDVKKGKQRLIVNDLLYFAMGLRANNNAPTYSKIIFKKAPGYEHFIKSLPFELTEDQNNVLSSMCETCSSGKRLNTLLYGDVGSGKTVIAVALMMLAMSNGYQCVLMAPRSVLAFQHYLSVLDLTGVSEEQVVYLHSGMKTKERKDALKKIKDGTASIIVGTHSCISAAVEYKNLGAVIIDEEHLFGVQQKEAIKEKALDGIHMLSMSATPIPRTLAGVVYGEDRTIEQLLSLPKGRLPIKTAIVPKREQALAMLLKETSLNHQCYIVCPAIEEDNDANLTSVEEMESLYGKYCESNGITFASINGKMTTSEIEDTMKHFADGDTQVLISTTVVEVGVNVPNATLIIIEQAERFGLASLHQLRGRVGRGREQSYCILRSGEEDNERLNVIAGTTNGITIAEADLAQRGSGDLFGLRQSGSNRFVELMLAYPELFKKLGILADWCIKHRFGEKLAELYADSDES